MPSSFRGLARGQSMSSPEQPIKSMSPTISLTRVSHSSHCTLTITAPGPGTKTAPMFQNLLKLFKLVNPKPAYPVTPQTFSQKPNRGICPLTLPVSPSEWASVMHAASLQGVVHITNCKTLLVSLF